MESLVRDLRLSFKRLWTDRGFALTSILTLAICVGANVAIFTIVRSVLLKPLPVPDSDRILLMSNQYPNAGVARSSNSGVPDYFDRLQGMSVFDVQALFNSTSQVADVSGSPERLQGMAVTPSWFGLVQTLPALGRAFDEAESEVGNDQKVILSHSLWQQVFGGDAGVIGREMRLNGVPRTVVGVMPPGFLFVDPEVRLWIPLAFTPVQRTARHSNNWFNVGRLKAGTTLEQAQAQVDAINAENASQFPQWKAILENAGFFTSVEPLQEMMVRDVRNTLYVLWAGAALVLLIGVVNIANLALARSNVRLKELGTRLAIGAGRAQVVRQWITESVVVSLLGVAAGLGAGWALLRLLSASGFETLPRATEIQMDWAVAVVTLLAGLTIGVVVGLLGVGHVYRLNLAGVLLEEGRTGTAGRKTQRSRRVLIVAQVGFAFVLLMGSGLLLSSFRHLLAVDPGFNSRGVVTAATGLPRSRYATDSDVRTFMRRALEEARSIPGVVSAGAGNNVPFDGNSSDSVILAEGYVMQPGESLVSPRAVVATTGYLESLGIPIVRGRYFDARDGADSPGAIIVDAKLARKFWQDQNPVGRRMYFPSDAADLMKVGPNTRWFTVVGVVGEVMMTDLQGGGNDAGMYYLAAEQQTMRSFVFTIKSATPAEGLVRTLRSRLATIDPELPLFDVRTMDERLDLSLYSQRSAMWLALGFGAVALLLSAVGIYGVLAYTVTQRTREIGIRIALGSARSDIFRLVLREGLWIIGGGLTLGLLGSWPLRTVIERQIFGVRPFDPVVMALAIVVLGGVALFACTLPARRATRVDPVIVLQQ